MVVFVFVVFLLLRRKQDIVAHLYCCTQRFTDAYYVLGILQVNSFNTQNNLGGGRSYL